MSQLTKQAILSAFLDLLDEKPFDRISVVDIAQRSRINRNTFYYYYPDIFALVDDLLRVSSRELLERKPQGTTWNEILLEITTFARAHQSAVYHLFQSQNRDRIERYLYDIILIGTEALLESEAKALDVRPHDLHVSAYTMRRPHWVCSCAGCSAECAKTPRNTLRTSRGSWREAPAPYSGKASADAFPVQHILDTAQILGSILFLSVSIRRRMH